MSKPPITRRYSDPDLRTALAAIVGPENFHCGDEPLAHSYQRNARQGPSAKPVGSCLCVVKPKNEDELSAILRIVNNAQMLSGDKCSVVVQGGNTANSGQSTPHGKQVLISMEKFGDIQFDPASNNITVGAGVTIDQARAALTNDREIPVRAGIWEPNAKAYPQSRGTTIAGMFNTNAGGPDAVHYGMAGDHVLKFRLMKANGEIIESGSDYRSDNRTPKLKGLIAGSNGTMGIVTSITVRTVPREKQTASIIFEPKSPEHAVQIARRIKDRYPDMVRGLEYLSDSMLKIFRDKDDTNAGHYKKIFADGHIPKNGLVMVKFALPREGRETQDALKALGRQLEEEKLVAGGIIADKTATDEAWHMRRNVYFATHADGNYLVPMDLSLPPERILDYSQIFEDRLKERIHPDIKVGSICHLGFDVLHPEVLAGQAAVDDTLGGWPVLKKEIKKIGYELCRQMGGVESAEHGLGPDNMAYILPYMDPNLFKLHCDLNRQLDPKGIMNPAAKINEANMVKALADAHMPLESADSDIADYLRKKMTESANIER